MKIELHNNAIENFNEKFEALLFEIKINTHQPPQQKKFESDIVISKTISESEIIGEPIFSLANNVGDETAIFFISDGKQFGFINDDYVRFANLCENLQRISTLSGYISKKFLKDKAFEWVCKRYKNQISLKVWDYLKPILEESIQESEVLVPLHMIQIECQFNIGNVEFKQLTKQVYDSWSLTAFKNKENWEEENIKTFFEKERLQHQGFAAASVNVIAEKGRAKEIAFEEIERAVDILRIYDPAGFHPLTNSSLTITGRENEKKSKHYVLNDGIISTVQESISGGGTRIFIIDAAFLQDMKMAGMNILSELLRIKELNSFQKTFINALQIYSNSSLATTITDKIVSILVSLEALLLKGNEPIQQNVGERMAFSLSKNGDERKKVVDNLKTIYELRSKYIHHAYEITYDKMKDIQDFMMNAWLFHTSLIKNLYNIKTKEELIEKLDNLKYYGS